MFFLLRILDDTKSISENDTSSNSQRNETSPKPLAIFSLSSSSSSSSLSSLNESIQSSTIMSTRIIPVGLYHEQDSTTSNSTDEKNSNSYREQLPLTSAYLSSQSSSTTNSSTKRELISSLRPTSSFQTTIDSLTIEQILFNMVRFDVIKTNFCDFYQLGGYVRSGGFSDIHEGIRLSDSKQVVIKFIPKEKTKNWLMVGQKKYPAEILLHKAVHEIQGSTTFEFDLFVLGETTCESLV